MLIKVKDLTVLEIVSKSRRLNKGKHPHISHKQTHFRSRINAYARTKTPKYNYSIRSPLITDTAFARHKFASLSHRKYQNSSQQQTTDRTEGVSTFLA